MAIYNLAEGTTGLLEFQLVENGNPLALTNVSVTLLLEDKDGIPLTGAGVVVVSDAANGKVQFTPASINTFSAATSPYSVRWKLTGTLGGGISYVPSTTCDTWNIVGV